MLTCYSKIKLNIFLQQGLRNKPVFLVFTKIKMYSKINFFAYAYKIKSNVKIKNTIYLYKALKKINMVCSFVVFFFFKLMLKCSTQGYLLKKHFVIMLLTTKTIFIINKIKIYNYFKMFNTILFFLK